MENRTWMKTSRLVLVLVLALGFATGALAASIDQPPLRPGAVIDRSDLDQFAEVLNPAMSYAIAHGLSIKVVPSERVEWPAPYQQATEKYSGQVSLDENDSLKNYVAGLPFPNIDPADPKAPIKIAYNWRWGPFIPEQVSFSNLASRTFNFHGKGLSFVRDSANPDFRNEQTCDQAIVLRRAHRLSADSVGDGPPRARLCGKAEEINAVPNRASSSHCCTRKRIGSRTLTFTCRRPANGAGWR
jgi:hypothetical protein